jgi:probable rRNA maturation factor
VTAPRALSLFIENHAGRKGVPQRRSFEAWIGAIPDLRRRRVQINLLTVGTREGRQFNRRFRERDYATNVLSFAHEPLPGEKTSLLGDLVLCAPVLAREAAEQGKALRDHYAHLTIHGVLHLLGYNHENEADARRMEAREIRILAGLGIQNPYAGEV